MCFLLIYIFLISLTSWSRERTKYIEAHLVICKKKMKIDIEMKDTYSKFVNLYLLSPWILTSLSLALILIDGVPCSRTSSFTTNGSIGRIFIIGTPPTSKGRTVSVAFSIHWLIFGSSLKHRGKFLAGRKINVNVSDHLWIDYSSFI